MKKIILLLLMATAWSYGQECRFELKEVDSFTKTRKLQTKLQPLARKGAENISASFLQLDNFKYLMFRYHVNGIQSIVVGTSNKLSLMLNDNTVLDLTPAKITTGDVNAYSQTSIVVGYPITIENLNKIRSVGFKKVRFSSTRSFYDFDVTKEKWVAELNNNIDCFLKESI